MNAHHGEHYDSHASSSSSSSCCSSTKPVATNCRRGGGGGRGLWQRAPSYRAPQSATWWLAYTTAAPLLAQKAPTQAHARTAALLQHVTCCCVVATRCLHLHKWNAHGTSIPNHQVRHCATSEMSNRLCLFPFQCSECCESDVGVARANACT